MGGELLASTYCRKHHTIIFTSNKQPNEWAEYFDGNDDLMCSLDRIFDRTSIFDIKGESYRGRACTFTQ